MIVRRDNDRGAEPVQLDEQAQQAVADHRIDVAGGLVGEQQLGPGDHGPGDRRALLLAAGEDRGVGVDALAEADPAEQVGHVVAIIRLALAHDPQGKRHVLPGGQVVEQAEILENDANPAPELGAGARGELGHVLAENENQAPGRPERHEKKAQKRRLAGSRRSGQEVKGPGKHVKGDVAQDFGAGAVAEPHIVKANHPSS